MSIFHCLVIDSTTSKEVTTENPNLYCIPRYLLEDNPETNLSTEYYNRFVDSFNCKFECTVAEYSKEKNFYRGTQRRYSSKPLNIALLNVF